MAATKSTSGGKTSASPLLRSLDPRSVLGKALAAWGVFAYLTVVFTFGAVDNPLLGIRFITLYRDFFSTYPPIALFTTLSGASYRTVAFLQGVLQLTLGLGLFYRDHVRSAACGLLFVMLNAELVMHHVKVMPGVPAHDFCADGQPYCLGVSVQHAVIALSIATIAYADSPVCTFLKEAKQFFVEGVVSPSRAPSQQPSMLATSPHFFDDESDAPLLGRNLKSFLKVESAPALTQRVKSWRDLLTTRLRQQQIAPFECPAAEDCTEEAFLRLFQRDAERTYVPKEESDPSRERTKDRQNKHVEILRICVAEIKDYHQGLGYIAAFLGLFLEPTEVAEIVLTLHKSRDYCQGYFAAEPAAFVADARVLFQQVEKELPELHRHLASKGVIPEIFMTKWFVGLGLHVLPFEALFRYYELFLTHGVEYIFKFGMAYFRALQPDLMACTDTAGIMTLLRAEHPRADWKLPESLQAREDQEGFFLALVESALDEKLDMADLSVRRDQELHKAVTQIENAKKRAAELAAEDSDDEIVFSDED